MKLILHQQSKQPETQTKEQRKNIQQQLVSNSNQNLVQVYEWNKWKHDVSH